MDRTVYGGKLAEEIGWLDWGVGSLVSVVIILYERFWRKLRQIVYADFWYSYRQLILGTFGICTRGISH